MSKLLIYIYCVTKKKKSSYLLILHMPGSLNFVPGSKLFALTPPPITYDWTVPLLLDHSYLVGKLTSSKIAKSVRIFEVMKLLFQQFLNLSSSQRDISGPI